MGKSINKHKPQVNQCSEQLRVGFLQVLPPSGVPFVHEEGVMTVTSSITGCSNTYYVQCECVFRNGLCGPMYNCGECGGAGYKMMTQDQYNEMMKKKEIKDWSFCPHCGESLKK